MTAIRQSTTNHSADIGTLERLYLEKFKIINYSCNYKYLPTLDIGSNSNAFYIMIIGDLTDLSGKWESC